jgi:hypothetical protein
MSVGGELAPGMEPDKAKEMVVVAGAKAMCNSGSELSSKAGHGGALRREWQSEGERGESEWELRGIPIAQAGVGSSGRGRGARGGGGSVRRPCT